MTNVPRPQLAKATRKVKNLEPWVRKLQVALRRNGAKCGVDGDFFTGTEDCVKDIQRSYGLIQSGVVAAKEWAVLDWAVGPSATYYNSDPDFSATSLVPTQTITTSASNTDDEKLLAEIWNNFGGLIEALADDIDIDPSIALAIFSKESSGNTVRDGPTPGAGSVPAADRHDGEPIMRFENHVLFNRWAAENGDDDNMAHTSRADWYDLHFEYGTRPPSTSTKTHLGHKFQDPSPNTINEYPVPATSLTVLHPIGHGAQTGNLIQNRNRTAINLAAKVVGTKRKTGVILNATPVPLVDTVLETLPMASPPVAAPAAPAGGWNAYTSNSSVEHNRHRIRELEASIPAVSQDVEVIGGLPSATIESRVVTEQAIWNGKVETDADMFDTLKKYYDNCGMPTSKWTPSGTPWSSVFISWIIGDSAFPKSAAHRVYAHSALKNRVAGKSNSWHLFSISREVIKVEKGDIFVKPRGNGTKSQRGYSHGDVVYKITGAGTSSAKAHLAGGNVGPHTMKSNMTVDLTPEGLVTQAAAGDYLIILKKVLTPINNVDEDSGEDPREKFSPGSNVYNPSGEWIGVVDTVTSDGVTLVDPIPIAPLGPGMGLSEGDELFTDDFEQAYICTSFGCGQVMGFNHESVGYDSAQKMYDNLVVPTSPVNAPLTHCDGSHVNLRNSIYLFFDRFRSKHLLIRAANDADWSQIGKLYNGSSSYGDEIEEFVNIVQDSDFHGGVF